ncbi:hypothetical protein [Denitrobaculum tricleocarpae]|uniref:Uncharacterized protein n=1 Tax=Denitrobaculum tricleocarpae TaxID=2591009 RepID=A0A545TPD4_9PROT|nr:hypothetical protein [Denitrobaculum tricleocarpae]TQV79079.1 hypothetical protein FKG95_15500 [Denitrobaculum tricleocarpae]
MTSSAALPAPRSGLLGSWDRLVGPGMPRDENLLVIGSGIFGAVFAAWALAAQGASIWLIILGMIIALDVIGGAVCNVTETTKRWYHRPGMPIAQQASFVALHVLHISIVAWAFRGEGFDVPYALTLSACLLIAMASVLATPRRLKLPVAIIFYLVAIGLVLCWLGATPGLEWFVPVLFTKLMIGHLVP